MLGKGPKEMGEVESRVQRKGLSAKMIRLLEEEKGGKGD